jgi:hypothetical protein
MIAAVIHIAIICADYLLHAVPYILTAAQKAAVSAFHASLTQLHDVPHTVIAAVLFFFCCSFSTLRAKTNNGWQETSCSAEGAAYIRYAVLGIWLSQQYFIFFLWFVFRSTSEKRTTDILASTLPETPSLSSQHLTPALKAHYAYSASIRRSRSVVSTVCLSALRRFVTSCVNIRRMTGSNTKPSQRGAAAR